MTVNIVVPVRALATGKSRLAEVLTPAERARLIERMLRHVLQCASEAAPGRCYLVSADPALLDLANALGVHAIREAEPGQNAALQQVCNELNVSMPVMALSADLPHLATGDLHGLIDELTRADVIAAPDKIGTGTNALLLARPGLIPFCFGKNSHSRHQQKAEQGNLRFLSYKSSGLAFDVDTPADILNISQEYIS